jgi:hypothetical protein
MPTNLLSTALSLILTISVSVSCAVWIPAQEIASKSVDRLSSPPESHTSGGLSAWLVYGTVLSESRANEPVQSTKSLVNKNSSTARQLIEVRDSRLLVD